MPEHILEMVDVTAGYGRSMVLFDVNLTVPAGCSLVIIGGSGQGKSVMIKLALGLIRPDAGKLTRLQGCFVSDEEISRIAAFWKVQAVEGGSVVPPWNALMDHLGDEEELIQDATEVLHGLRTCSTSMLQRRLGLGGPGLLVVADAQVRC